MFIRWKITQGCYGKNSSINALNDWQWINPFDLIKKSNFWQTWDIWWNMLYRSHSRASCIEYFILSKLWSRIFRITIGNNYSRETATTFRHYFCHQKDKQWLRQVMMKVHFFKTSNDKSTFYIKRWQMSKLNKAPNADLLILIESTTITFCKTFFHSWKWYMKREKVPTVHKSSLVSTKYKTFWNLAFRTYATLCSYFSSCNKFFF